VPCGHPHVDAKNADHVIADGYRFLMAAPVRSFAGLEACRKLTGRA
jgi:4-hydroxy-2-oxoheptanedioate aldolase